MRIRNCNANLSEIAEGRVVVGCESTNKKNKNYLSIDDKTINYNNFTFWLGINKTINKY